MGNKLYVGNLSFRVTSEDLQEHFATAGAVESANVVMDRETGRSRVELHRVHPFADRG